MLAPSPPDGDVVIHEVLAVEATGYVRQDQTAGGGSSEPATLTCALPGNLDAGR
jgi:hypothetical protein